MSSPTFDESLTTHCRVPRAPAGAIVAPRWLARSLLPVVALLILSACGGGPPVPSLMNTNALVDQVKQDDGAPRVATDGKGNWLVTWQGNSSAFNLAGQDCPGTVTGLDVYTQFSSNNGKTWYGPFCLRKGASDRDPRVVADGKGSWTLIWAADGASGTDHDIFISRSTNATWAQPSPAHPWSLAKVVNTNASADAVDDFAPTLATDGAGSWVAAWDTYGGSPFRMDVVFALSADDIQSWSAPKMLSGGSQGQSDAAPAAAYGKGVWIIVWTSVGSPGLGTDGDILFSRSTDGVKWTVPAPLDKNAGTDSARDGSPRIATDGTGRWVVVWASDGGGTGADADILSSSSVDDGKTWSSPAPVNTNAATDKGDDRSPVVAHGGGQWFAVWQSDETFGGKFLANSNIFMTGDSWTGGVAPSWLTPSVVHSTAATDLGDDIEPSIAVDGQAKWIIVWSSEVDVNKKGLDYDILYVKTTGP